MIWFFKQSKTLVLPQIWGKSFLGTLWNKYRVSIASGMLDLAHGIKTIGHIYCLDKPRYYVVVNDLHKFPQFSPGELEGEKS